MGDGCREDEAEEVEADGMGYGRGVRRGGLEVRGRRMSA